MKEEYKEADGENFEKVIIKSAEKIRCGYFIGG